MSTYGIVLDTSNNNPITAAELKQSGAVGLIAKGTQGTGFKDAFLASQRAAAKAAGIPFAGYLFLEPTSPGSEAAYYIKYANPDPGETVFVDCEVTDGSPMSLVAKRALSCCTALKAAGHPPALYSSYSFLKQLYALQPGLAKWPCWEAQYPGRVYQWLPSLLSLRAKLMNGVSVDLWQFTDTYRVGQKLFDASVLLVPANVVFGKGAT